MPRKRSRNEVFATLKRASVYLVPYRRQLGVVFLLILAVSLISLTFPALQGCIIDVANGHRPRNAMIGTLLPNGARGLHALMPLFLLFAVLLMVRAAALLTRNHLMQTTGMHATCDVRVAIFSHLQKLSLRFYEERQTGRVVARVTEDAGAMHQLVTSASVGLLGDLTQAVGVLGLLFFYNWLLAILVVLTVPLSLLSRWLE